MNVQLFNRNTISDDENNDDIKELLQDKPSIDVGGMRLQSSEVATGKKAFSLT